MKGIQLEPPYVETASRMELLYRFGYLIIYYIVVLIAAFVIWITLPLQWLSILIFGKRHKLLNNINKVFFQYVTEYVAYFYLLTDERPKLIPDTDAINK